VKRSRIILPVPFSFFPSFSPVPSFLPLSFLPSSKTSEGPLSFYSRHRHLTTFDAFFLLFFLRLVHHEFCEGGRGKVTDSPVFFFFLSTFMRRTLRLFPSPPPGRFHRCRREINKEYLLFFSPPLLFLSFPLPPPLLCGPSYISFFFLFSSLNRRSEAQKKRISGVLIGSSVLFSPFFFPNRNLPTFFLFFPC